MSEIERVLDPLDPFCPKCGHNRDTSSVSSIDEGGGRKSCQLCGTKWSEDFAEQVRQLLAAEREAAAVKCDAEVARLTEQGELRAAIVAGICAAAIRKG